MKNGIRTKAFTLIELITVIIIIGIMLGVALPKYMKMAEKTKANSAKRVLDILRKAEESHYAENSFYINYDGSDASATGGIVEDIPHSKINGDDDWVYGVINSTGTEFTATAERASNRGPVSGTISLDQNGDFSYSGTGSYTQTDVEKYWK